MELRSKPKLTVTTETSPLYESVGYGYTDPLFLLGHADNVELNSPTRVTSMRDTLDLLGEDSGSPLVHGLLQAYFAGARDLYFVAIAPMSEYEPDLGARDTAYYEAHRDRLNTTYSILEDYDAARIVVPLEAPFNATVDFATPLVNHCVDMFNKNGEICIGILGTRGDVNDDLLDRLMGDPRLSSAYFGQEGRFVSVFVGEGVFNFRELPINSRGSFAASCAATLAKAPLGRGIMNSRIEGALNVTGGELDPVKVNALAEMGLNTVGRNTKGRRGTPFQVVALTDNTLAAPGSESFYWGLPTTKLVGQVNRSVRAIARRRIGKMGEGEVRSEIENYLRSLVEDQVLRTYSVGFYRDPVDIHKMYIELSLVPFFTLREIEAHITIGPLGA